MDPIFTLRKVSFFTTFRKVFIMSGIELNIDSWIDLQQASGRSGFSLDSIKKAFPESSNIAIKYALIRRVQKGKILSIHKGYYLIIPPQYSAHGVLPPALFLDAMMKSLRRPYYVSLLSAAALQGAAHQQPQEFFVVTGFPAMRPTVKKGIKINYISVKHFPEKLLEKRKTESGYIYVSNPALTATDLLQFEKRIGGINRAATVINELSENIRDEHFNSDLLQHAEVTALQRLGFILENVCGKLDLADALFNAMKKHELSFLRIPLKSGKPMKGFSSANRWNVVVNTEIGIDE